MVLLLDGVDEAEPTAAAPESGVAGGGVAPPATEPMCSNGALLLLSKLAAALPPNVRFIVMARSAADAGGGKVGAVDRSLVVDG